MTTKYAATLSSMGTSFVVAIPKPIVEGFGLEKGQKLDLYASDDGIYIPLKAKPTGMEDIIRDLARRTRK
jgi:bifunctional DNA-binding transcriptional regulator/antitoxin component of YhaV-PrlF toxin-antitoxin module